MSLPTIREALEKRGDVCKAIVLGAMATATARTDSDLDIAIGLGV
jgi:predicted nucleotidyltransferase